MATMPVPSRIRRVTHLLAILPLSSRHLWAGPKGVALAFAPVRLTKRFPSAGCGTICTAYREDGSEGGGERVQGKRTLYDVLRCPPDATRDELKRSYAALARVSHPDAVLGGGGIDATGGPADDVVDFNEIAVAWRVLSDAKSRKRYDRSLQAERFTEEVAEIADQMTDEMLRPVVRAVGRVAVPFAMKTAKTAAAGLKAVGDGLGKVMNSGKGDKLIDVKEDLKEQAVSVELEVASETGDDAIVLFDESEKNRVELIEESLELDQLAKEVAAEAKVIKSRHAALRDRRLKYSIRDQSLPLTPSDARRVTELWLNGPPSHVEVAVIRRFGLDTEIELLEEAEQSFAKTGTGIIAAEKRVEERKKALWKVQRKEYSAEETEIRLKESLMEALEVEISTRQALISCSDALETAENEFRRLIESVDLSPTLEEEAANTDEGFYFPVPDEASAESMSTANLDKFNPPDGAVIPTVETATPPGGALVTDDVRPSLGVPTTDSEWYLDRRSSYISSEEAGILPTESSEAGNALSETRQTNSAGLGAGNYLDQLSNYGP